jgi:sugar diacid utilization regulator
MSASLGTLHKPSAAAVLARLEADAEAIARRMALAARAEVHDYGAVRDPAFAAEVLAHALEHVRAFIRAGRAGRPPEGEELDFVRERGAQRARELMPLDALLETYLIGQRTVWEAIVEAAGDTPVGMRTAQELTALTFRYTHAINVAVAHAFLRESRALASEAERGRRDLLDRLLSGRAPGAEEERRAEALGLRPGGDHAIVVALAGEEAQAERLIVRALVREERENPFVVARHGEVVAIVPVYVRRGPRELRAALERAAGLLRRSHAVSLRAGVSSICSGLGEVGRGYSEAGRALRHAGDATAVVALEEISLFDYLAEAADDTAHKLVPAGAGALLRADDRARGALSTTLRAYAACDLNVARAAQQLAVHPNTVHYRLRRVQELSGRNPRRFGDLVELMTALRLVGRDQSTGVPSGLMTSQSPPNSSTSWQSTRPGASST